MKRKWPIDLSLEDLAKLGAEAASIAANSALNAGAEPAGCEPAMTPQRSEQAIRSVLKAAPGKVA